MLKLHKDILLYIRINIIVSFKKSHVSGGWQDSLQISSVKQHYLWSL